MSALRTLACAVALAVSSLTVPAALAQTLTIVDETGDAPVTIELTLEEIEAMERHEIRTNTVWTDRTITFSGVRPATIAELISGAFTEVQATALNEFSVFVPLADFAPDADVIIATRADGEPMAVRDNGPFWLMFNFDTLDQAGRTAAEQRSIWQLSRLVFR